MDNRSDRNTCNLWGISLRCHHPAPKQPCPDPSSESGKPDDPASSCVLRVYRNEDRDRAPQRPLRMDRLCRHHRRGDDWKMGGCPTRCASYRIELAGIFCAGRSCEHARPDGIDCAERWAGTRSDFTDAIYDDGSDGTGDHDCDNAVCFDVFLRFRIAPHSPEIAKILWTKA